MSSGGQSKIKQNCNSLLRYLCLTYKKSTQVRTWGNQRPSRAASLTKRPVPRHRHRAARPRGCDWGTAEQVLTAEPRRPEQTHGGRGHSQHRTPPRPNRTRTFLPRVFPSNSSLKRHRLQTKPQHRHNFDIKMALELNLSKLNQFNYTERNLS